MTTALRVPPHLPGRPTPFPFQPAFDALCPTPKYKRNGARWSGTVAQVALRLGVDRQHVYRWLRRGLDDVQADVVAIMLGLHPCLIWDDWFALSVEKSAEPTPWDQTTGRLEELRRQGLGQQQIAGILTREGLPTRRGGLGWDTAKVIRALRYMRRESA
jgi:hypothetical protein